MTEQRAEGQIKKETLRDKSVLIVDDDSAITSLLPRVFARKGSIVNTAANGKEALEAVKNKKPDLIITDNSMPQMTGPELIEQLRSNPLTQDIPIILMSGDLFSGLDQMHIEEKAASLGANAGIAKPFVNIFAPAEIAEKLLSPK